MPPSALTETFSISQRGYLLESTVTATVVPSSKVGRYARLMIERVSFQGKTRRTIIGRIESSEGCVSK
jgi:hypothetical protein